MNTASFPLFYHRSQINANLVELGLTCPCGKYYNINCDFMLRRRRAWPDGKADRIDLHPRRDERNSGRRRAKGAVRRLGGRLKAVLRDRASFRLFRKGGKPKCRASGGAAKSAFFGDFQTRSRAIRQFSPIWLAAARRFASGRWRDCRSCSLEEEKYGTSRAQGRGGA